MLQRSWREGMCGCSQLPLRVPMGRSVYALLTFSASSSSIHPRSQEPALLLSRTPGVRRVIWCAPGQDSRTFIIVQLATTIGGPFISELLTKVSNIIEAHIQRFGDGFLTVEPYGVIGWPGRDGFHLRVWDNPGHELTYQVMHSAVQALYDYMSNTHWAETTFEIYDSGGKVGMGFLSR